MIDQALDFLCRQVNNYLLMQLHLPPGSNAIILFNVSQLGSETNGGGNADSGSNAFLTLVNIEEDRVSKSQENFIRRDNKVLYKNPAIHLNVYLLFSVNLTYAESLKRLSCIIQFFQFQNVFTPLTSPSLPPGIDELILDLYSASFQDLNNLWGILGSKYLPSVMYKMRLISISDPFIQGEAELIRDISITDKQLQS